jgi:hypothetical protein
MRPLLLLLTALLLSSFSAAEDFSLVAFLKTCPKDLVLNPSPEAEATQREADLAIKNRIFDIYESVPKPQRNERVIKLMEPEHRLHLRALAAAPEKRFEDGLGWRKGDGVFSVELDYQAGGVADLKLLLNARTGRMVYYLEKEPKVYAGDWKHDELSADEQALVQAGLAFYCLCIETGQPQSEKYLPFLHPTVRRAFKATLLPGSRLLPPKHSDGTYFSDNIRVTMEGAVGRMEAFEGHLVMRLKQEKGAWLVLEMREGGK